MSPSVNLGPLYLGFYSLTTLRQIIFMFFILAFLRHICCQGHESRSNVVCEGQPLCHSALRCCLVIYFNFAVLEHWLIPPILVQEFYFNLLQMGEPL